ncbi:MAG: zf-HC2 domain-containing protein [Planctomycetota bacterium]|jgi:hypothetical protein
MTCETYKKLIGKFLDGHIEPEEQRTLQTHLMSCSSCRDEYEDIERVGELLQETFNPQSSTFDVRDKILSELPLQHSGGPEGERPTWPGYFRWLLPAAACLMLMVGGLVGFQIGHWRITGKDGGVKKAPVNIQISQLDGTVLVKHQGAEVWEELTAETDIYLGDRFESINKSGMTLALWEGCKLELEDNSSLSLNSYNGGIDFGLGCGSAKASLASDHPPFYISTPQGRIQALGTEFVVTVK